MAMIFVKNILVLDNDGKRICAKYYNNDFGDHDAQLTYEKNLFEKTRKAKAAIIHFERNITVYQKVTDHWYYVTGGLEENELILMNIVETLVECISTLATKGTMDKRTLFENLDLLYLILDEMIDNGILLEIHKSTILERVREGADNQQTVESSLGQALQSATRSLMKY